MSNTAAVMALPSDISFLEDELLFLAIVFVVLMEGYQQSIGQGDHLQLFQFILKK